MKTINITLSSAALSLMLAGTASAARNHDQMDRHFLSRQEAVQDALQSLRQQDFNRDGVVSMREVDQKRGNVTFNNNRGSRYDQWYRTTGFKQYSRDTDDLITKRNFHQFDLNHNRVITPLEVRKLVVKKFKAADGNRDGYLSLREIERSNFFDAPSHQGGKKFNDYRDYEKGQSDRNHRR